MTTLAKLGSISHGTCNPSHLIPRFIDALTDLIDSASLLPTSATFKETEAVKKEYARIMNLIAGIEERCCNEDHETNDPEDESEDLESLFNELDAFAPEFCYFGSHEGDGSDYGFWPSGDAIRDAKHDGDLAEGDSLPEEITTDYFLVVSDHGNATLYNREGKEIWAIV